jgi:hypothetical protein
MEVGTVQNIICKHLFLWATLILVPLLLLGQSSTSTDPVMDKKPAKDSGFELYESFGGSFNTFGNVMSLDTSTGYRFNKYFGVTAGLPVYFVHDDASTTANGQSLNSHGIGDVYFGPQFWASNKVFNFSSTLLATAPTGSVDDGLSSGRYTLDWNNHIDHSFKHLQPFVEAGIGNSIPNIGYQRPFTSYGTVGHLEGGSLFKFNRYVAVGASGYGIFPTDDQRVFSRVVHVGQLGTPPVHGRHFLATHEVFGSSDLTRESGFSAWIGSAPTHVMDVKVGYTRSATYDLDTISFRLGVDLARMFREQPKTQ